jgi:hypothetical protein
LIDIRYHVYSLAAVFFALAVGIVFGTTFARTSPATGSERRTIQRYENSMRVLKREIEKTSEGAARNEELARSGEEFCKAALPIVAKGRLLWRNVAIIQTGDYDDLTGSVKHAVELAGARVAGVTTISRTFPFGDDKKIAEAISSCGATPPEDSKKAREKLFSIIADTVCAGTYYHLISKIEDLGVASFSDDSSRSTRLRLVVLVGGAASEQTNAADTVDAQLVSRLERFGVTCVGCENSDAASSYVAAWHKMGIATVDNADSAIGQIALLCALNGENAKFGVKDTADRLIPRTLEAK